jgi:hypothetical protein
MPFLHFLLASTKKLLFCQTHGIEKTVVCLMQVAEDYEIWLLIARPRAAYILGR